MSNELIILCGKAEQPSQIQGQKEPLRFQFFGPHKNADLRIQDIHQRFITNISDVFIDLLEIASYVYCADQAIPRGGKTDPQMGANWRRRLNFHIPVRRYDIWSSPEILECLSMTLGFLSDDFYTFTFTKLKNPPPFDKYLEGMGQMDLPPEEVVLFSGGLDSLAGAVQEAAIEKKRTILVSHRASPKILNKQLNLVKDLQARLDNPPLAHVPVWVTKHGAWEAEYTQRTRSFLFAALGATMAKLFGLNKIRMYENGVVSLNLPISAQLIGARASRTTHPQVLKGFGELFSLITGKPFLVENPFLWKTKSEVVKILGEAGCADLIKYSVSCSHVWGMTTLHSHCGKCSQCIDRRFAVLASGYGEDEPSEMYKVDLFRGAREKLEDKTMIESYVRTATLINKMTDFEFFTHFGEATRVFAHLEGTADENAARILDLHKRHAKEICGVIEDAIKDHAHEILNEALSPSCLLILALPESYRGSKESQPSEPKPARNIFRKEGHFWRIIYAGKEILLKDAKGLRYIAYLLRHPEQDFYMLNLKQEAEISPSNSGGEIYKKMCKEKLAEEGLVISNSGDGGDVIDAQALADYKREIKDLDGEIREAEENHDLARLETLRDQKELFLKHIMAASGLLGRTRKFDDEYEKARKSITKCIIDSRRKIQKDHLALGQHLENSINTGSFCSYTPEKPTPWEF
jgi:7-cyano-7-deazaguanine synthase in queuosine biosynthesis